jgi:hypothetical protein
MNEIIKLDNISQFNDLRGIETLHPLVSVFEFSKMKLIRKQRHIMVFIAYF